MSFAEANTKSRRLAILRLLAESEGSANESVLKQGLHLLGFAGRQATADAVREDLAWLKDRGLVGHTWYEARVLVVTLTRRGEDYLNREVEPIDGIEYPRMGK
ncbi:VpaChn25_0724 family phage protein [Inquilinus sp. CA228]|uniref:VpaChn25_0724 family phage protein n=1 Tax=Inquilinus sp. CA228 TaxID=3455609 RepID=UPI003F8D2382